MHLLESPRRGVHIKILYNSKFDLTAKSLVTNTVVIRRVLCNCLLSSIGQEYGYLELSDMFLSQPAVSRDSEGCLKMSVIAE